MVVSSTKVSVLVFHKKHAIVLTSLELMHRQYADVRCFSVIVNELVLEYRFLQRGFGTLVVALLPPQFR